jgi:hypothetical protein
VTIDEAAKKIAVTVYGTVVTSLTPTITYTGASIDPALGVARNFTNPVTYIVTAEDGSTATYTVTVTVIFTDMSDIEDYLAAAPAPVSLPVALNLASDWTNLLAKIQAAGKDVELDLSACTMSGTEFNPGVADTGERYIVSLVLPDAATGIKAGVYPNSTFRYFTGLTEVSGTGITGVGNYTFYTCTTLSSVTLPAATTVGHYAFTGCTALSSVSLPAATTISDYAFSACTALTDLTFGRDAAPWPTLGENVFSFTGTGTLTIHVPSGTVSHYTAAWGVPVSVSAGNSVYGTNHKKINIIDTP